MSGALVHPERPITHIRITAGLQCESIYIFPSFDVYAQRRKLDASRIARTLNISILINLSYDDQTHEHTIKIREERYE
ncbi:hypothetical protein GCM10011273_25570 [Asticcacaulis endophyticus]|uniref:Uncharacterized protein n=1 Tax=Asticcacaulis endophyticus TaxID=1395890 RepID=A0A918UVT5_9CAUL|nr:hypothetical protein GCM10011273_25570 [Asticcacaulis endophyticus]